MINFLRLLAAASLAAVVTLVAPVAAHGAVRDGLILFGDYDTQQLYTIAPDGTRLHQLTFNDSYDASWSADGRQIAYNRIIGGVGQVWVMNADGSDQHQAFTDPGYNDDLPRFLPGNQELVFARCPADYEGCGLASVAADGSGLRMLTPIDEGLDYAPAVAPDGRIAFIRFLTNGISAQLFVLNRSGTARAVTPASFAARRANWSPDGKTLIFDHCCVTPRDIYTISVNGAHLHRITHTPYPYVSVEPAFSPTGTHIVYESSLNHPNPSYGDLYIMPTSGRHPRMINTGLRSVVSPSWAPAVAP